MIICLFLPIKNKYDLSVNNNNNNKLKTFFYERQEIDLGQILLDELILSLPMRYVCRIDCPGVRFPIYGSQLIRKIM